MILVSPNIKKYPDHEKLTSEPLYRDERFMRKPQENADRYDSNSPINHVSKLKGKLLLVHGAADDNVNFQNSMEMTNAFVKAGKQFDMFFYPNRNHGIYGGNTRLHLYTMMTDYVLKNL